MAVTTASLTNIYGFPIGRRMYVQREVEKRARARAITTVADKAAQGLAHDMALMVKRMRVRASSDALYGPDAVSVDNQLDHCVTGFDAFLDSQERMYLGDRRGEVASRLRRELLPSGPGAVIRLAYVQQHAHIDAMLARLDEPELAGYLVEIPELVPMVARLRTLNQRYDEVLNAYDTPPSMDELRAADARGQELLAETLVLIQAHFIASAPQDHDGRAYMLEPILRQNEAIRATRRRRRPARDVDPETGVELPEDDVPSGDEPPAA